MLLFDVSQAKNLCSVLEITYLNVRRSSQRLYFLTLRLFSMIHLYIYGLSIERLVSNIYWLVDLEEQNGPLAQISQSNDLSDQLA